MRGCNATVHFEEALDTDDVDEADRCRVNLESPNNGCGVAISELGEIFDPSHRDNGQGQYCDWACKNGEAIVKALAELA